MSSFQRLFCTLLYVAGTVGSVLIKGVSSFQRLFCTLLYVAGTVGSVLIKGGVPISGIHIREVPLYTQNYCLHAMAVLNLHTVLRIDVYFMC